MQIQFDEITQNGSSSRMCSAAYSLYASHRQCLVGMAILWHANQECKSSAAVMLIEAISEELERSWQESKPSANDSRGAISH
jgi:hypothetical protein